MADTISQELLRLNQKLLDSIAQTDWKTYQELCDPTLTCFEPEAMGQLVEGMEFHRFYFQLPGRRRRSTRPWRRRMCRVIGDVAVISYVRLNQRITGRRFAHHAGRRGDSRVWQKQNGAWKHVHFHRSVPAR